MSTYIIQQKFLYKRDVLKYGNSQSGRYKGIEWNMRRNNLGCWCGYINITFPYNEDDYDEVERCDKKIHGGITNYTPNCVGFDCSHLEDFIPTSPRMCLPKKTKVTNAIYRSYAYVLNEIENFINDFFNYNKKPLKKAEKIN